jgi:hypothetical protein
MLNHLKNSPDWGFNSTCFFGYPTRQYLISSLPSLFLGRNVFALNLGGSIYIILGLVIFASGLIKHFGNKSGNLSVAFFLSTLWHIPYLIHFTFLYEQSTFPFSLGLIISGIFLQYMNEKKICYLPLIGFCLLTLIHAYTPSLAFYFLAIAILVYYVTLRSQARTEKLIILTLIIFSLFSFFHSVKIRKDLNFTSSQKSSSELLRDFQRGIKHFIFPVDRPTFVSPYLQLPLISVITLSLTGTLGKEIIIIGLWMIGVIGTAILSKGYTYYVINFRLHRAMVTFPIFYFLSSLTLKMIYSSRKLCTKLIWTVIVIMCISSVFNLKTFFKTKLEDKNRDLSVWINQQPFSEKYEQITITPQVRNQLKAYEDTLQYFAPNLQTRLITNNICNPEIEKPTIYLIEKENPCNALLANSPGWVTSDSFLNLNTYLSAFTY